MNTACTGEWSRKFINTNFPDSFIKTDLRDHKKGVLFQQELSFMPQTQSELEVIIKIQKLKQKIDSNYSEIFKIRHTAFELNTKLVDAEKRKRILLNEQSQNTLAIKKFQKQFKHTNDEQAYLKIYNESGLYENSQRLSYEIKSNKLFIKRQMRVITNEISPETEPFYKSNAEIRSELHNIQKKTTKTRFVRKCGDSECHGFVSSQWKCGLCEKKTCIDCHEIVDDPHICEPDTVATVELLKNDTKNCPSSGCQTAIFKIDGCDQMWCPQCKTAWSWNTGQIEKKIHNPHYYEWRRQMGTLEREPGDVPCGEIDNELTDHFVNTVIELFEKHTMISTECKGLVLDVIQRCNHISAYNHINMPDPYEANKMIRFDYLKKTIEEKQFKSLLIRRQKASSLKTDNYNILNLLTITVTDILFRFRLNLHETVDGDCNLEILDEICNIVMYINDCLLEIRKTYDCASVIQYDYYLTATKQQFKNKPKPSSVEPIL